jgi:hypothetical protein
MLIDAAAGSNMWRSKGLTPPATQPSHDSTYPILQHTHGESYGWEALIRERGELFVSHSAFITKAAAIRWAEDLRKAMESESWVEPLPPVRIE